MVEAISGGGDGAVLVSTSLPAPGLFAPGAKADALEALAADLRDLDKQPRTDAAAPAEHAINDAIDAGAILAIVIDGQPVTVYAPGLSISNHLTPMQGALLLRGLRDVADFADPAAQVRIGQRLGGSTRTTTLARLVSQRTRRP